MGCASKKHNKSEKDVESVKTAHENESDVFVQKEEAASKIQGDEIKATLNCSGNSGLSLLQLSAKKYDTQDFECRVSRSSGLKVRFTSESKKMEIILHLVGIETFTFKKAKYGCKSDNPTNYLDVSLNAKSLGQHNFGESFEGALEIVDYGMSSDVICGKFAVIDKKGNKIEGSFNETISLF